MEKIMEIRWKNNTTKAIGVAKLTDDDEDVLEFVGYKYCPDEDCFDDDYDGELVETWKSIKEDDKWFGVVRWCDDDLKNALETHGIATTKYNVNKLKSLCLHHSFVDLMIEQGWEYIYNKIATNFWEEDDE